MACFAVPAVEAVAVTAVAFILQKRETARAAQVVAGTDSPIEEHRTTFSRKLKWLRNLLFGGAFLLAFEHVWHGEVVPWFPFLTAAQEGSEAVAEMLHEMATVGVTMAVLITLVWVGMVLVSNALEKRAAKLQPQTANENL